jgi:hypothetical protein
VGDGEDADAALRAAGVADEVMTAAVVGVGYSGVYDLDEGLRHLAFVKGLRLRECPHLRIEIWAPAFDSFDYISSAAVERYIRIALIIVGCVLISLFYKTASQIRTANSSASLRNDIQLLDGD